MGLLERALVADGVVSGAGAATTVGHVASSVRAGRPFLDLLRGPASFLARTWCTAELHRRGVILLGRDGGVEVVDPDLMAELCGPARGAPSRHVVACRDDDVDWEDFRRLRAARVVRPDPELFQTFETIESLQRRIWLLSAGGDLDGVDIAQLGDDELFAYALAATGRPGSVTMFDVDERLVAETRHLAESRSGLAILRAERVDLTEPLDGGLGWDVFFVSGLKDPSGLRLFLLNGVAMSKAGGGVGYLSIDLDVLGGSVGPVAGFSALLRYLDVLGCQVTQIVDGDEADYSHDLVAFLAGVTVDAAAAGLPPARLRERLLEGLDRPEMLPLRNRYRFPDVSLPRCTTMRICFGEAARGEARSRLRRLQRLRRRSTVGARSEAGGEMMSAVV